MNRLTKGLLGVGALLLLSGGRWPCPAGPWGDRRSWT